MKTKLIASSTFALTILLATVCHADSASGLATGKRQHKPITITKHVDKATPALITSTQNGEKSVKSQYRLCPDGTMINPGEKCPEKNAKK